MCQVEINEMLQTFKEMITFPLHLPKLISGIGTGRKLPVSLDESVFFSWCSGTVYLLECVTI